MPALITRLTAWCLAAAVALLLGACSADAPPEFQPVFETKEAAVTALLDALWQRDVDRMRNLAVSETEFRKHVWPRLPAAAGAAESSMSYWWEDLRARSLGSMAQVLEEHGGTRLSLEAVSFEGGVTDYGTFRVHREARVSARDTAGNLRELRLFGSLVEAPSGWKIYSYVID